MQEDTTNDSIQAAPREDSLFEWEAVLFGPSDTIWEGGMFTLILEFSDEYPNKPPKVKFTTKMFHPNIYNDGRLCLDILNTNWSPVYDVSSILTSIQSLLCDPNPNSPANAEAAQMIKNDYQGYCERVKQCVEDSSNGGDDMEDD